MQCPNCGSQNKISIKQRHYCAECGEPFVVAAAAAPAADHSHSAKPKATSHRAPQVLDLSTHPQTKAAQPRAHKSALRSPLKPAQSIHGVRRQPTPAPITSSAKSAPVASSHHVHHPAQQSQTISKFSPSLRQISPRAPAADEPPAEPVMLAPLQTYQVNRKVAQADRAAAIALHHDRYQPPQAAKTAPPHLNHALKKHRRRPRLLRSLKGFFKAQPRLATVSATVLVVLILGGYITYLNYPGIALRVAASRAGFDASVPHYTPPGYSFSGPVNYGPGQIVVRFSSNSDAGFITLAQRKTDWDSATLLENYVLPKTTKYLTFQQDGLIIYMYNGNNAAWVNRGVFYSIEGNNYLNTEQVLKIAASL